MVALLDVVPADERLLSGIGSVAVTSAYTWALVARAGGRPLLFGALALLLGVGVLVLDEDWLRTGAAVMTCAVASVLGVMLTVPAQRFVQAARECALAVLVAAGGALAMLGFEPVIAQVRFEYTVFGLSLLAAFALVHRLGAGLHGLGRRGLVGVLGGGILLALTLAYAELLRRYGPGDAVDSVLDGVRWTRETLGAFPRPIETVLACPPSRGLPHARPAPSGLVDLRLRRGGHGPGDHRADEPRPPRCSRRASRWATASWWAW